MRSYVRNVSDYLQITIGIFPKAKIIISFFQVVSSFETVYGLKLPDRVLQVKRLFDWTKVEWLGVVLPSGCMGGFKDRLLVYALAPILLVWVVFVGVLVYSAYTSSKNSVKGALSSALLAATPLALYVTFLFVPSVSAKIFTTWFCKQYRIDGETSITFLGDELSLQCNTPNHDQIKPVAWLLVVLWPIGVVALYLFVLLKCRAPIMTRRPNKLAAAALFLHQDYEVGSARARAHTHARTHARTRMCAHAHTLIAPSACVFSPSTSIGKQSSCSGGLF
jgi:hypothetical protein